MRPIKIAIPAGSGSFHHHAAIKYFGEYNVVAHYNSMRDALTTVKTNAADYAVLACENTSAGIFSNTYREIFESGLFIVDELHHPVSLCLAGKKDIDVNQISHIYSHPYALMQLTEQFQNGWGLHHSATPDTTAAAKLVGLDTRPDTACVCEESIAKKHDLKILVRDIQKCNPNYTRFLIVSKGSILHARYEKIIGKWPGSPDSLSSLIGKWAFEKKIIIQDQSVFFEFSNPKGWDQNSAILLNSKSARIFGHSYLRQPDDEVTNQIHISL